ncbi:MAG: cupin domain-containing protein [Candidatus Moranbacteria bacterium CG10_big_fil_rev_8_21_14_0_10_35_21]|nr:MAG: cupin domain-containing protein [Candidatus Moranbacteria bacterium CG10_big_fil_rev_8_21_14_0_10_35_21]PJA88595.1 MAG: cupin domain-containing protein [Candidatus Moranbacteria bacterium CG_4_9_14_3_um_filter_36_9]
MHQELKKLIEYPSSGILSKEIDKNEKVEISLFCMAKGTDLSEHTSTREGLVVVLDGEGEFILEGKNIKMTPGVLIHMQANAVHSLKAQEKNTAFLLILFN